MPQHLSQRPESISRRYCTERHKIADECRGCVGLRDDNYCPCKSKLQAWREHPCKHWKEDS